MVKSELALTMSEKLLDLSLKDLDFCTTKILSTMSDALAEGERVEVRGFGSFCLHYRGKRNAHNPKTGEGVITMPKHAVYFKPGINLKNRVNEAFLATQN
jgi:integration host factor subunit beta